MPAITVGTDPTDTYAEPYYAQDIGFFKAAGLDATVTDLQNGAAIAAVVASGAVDVGVAPTFLFSAWFTTRAFAQQNAAVLKRFVSATYLSGRWANAHHAESGVILAKYSKLGLDTVRSMARSTMSDGIDINAIQPQLDVAFKYGVLPKAVDARDMLLT